MTTLSVAEKHLFWRGDTFKHKKSRECPCEPRTVYERVRPYIVHNFVNRDDFGLPVATFPPLPQIRPNQNKRMLRFTTNHWKRQWMLDLGTRFLKRVLGLGWC